MQRIRAAACLLASAGLVGVLAAPVAAEAAPPSLTIHTSVSHYIGGWWEQQIAFNVSCDGYGTAEVWVDLPGGSEDVLAQLGSPPAGTACWLDVSYFPEAGDMAGWNDPEYSPNSGVTLEDGANTISVNLPRVWADGWPPQDDVGVEYALQVTVDRIYLNGRGGIEVEGTSWCPDAAALIEGPSEPLYAGASWQAIQYVGRKSAIHAGWDSAIAHPCWDVDDPDHGPYPWQTRYAYPSGALQFVYGYDGKFGSGSIHVEAVANTDLVTMSQNFAPGGWTSFEGDYVPYDAACQDNDGDGWCVTHAYWSGWAPADLKPIRVR